MAIHTIQFNQSVTYTGANPQGGAVEGVSFVNTTTAETASLVAHSTNMAIPNQVIAYDVTWSVAPVSGDVVEWRYDSGTGNYQDSDTTPMATQTLVMTNCLDLSPVGVITDPLNGDFITDPLNGDFITDPNPA